MSQLAQELDAQPIPTLRARREFIPDLSSVRVAVIGDVMLDVYVHGATRLSGESGRPITVFRESGVTTHRPGGAANAAANAAALCGAATVYGLIGNDLAGNILMREVARLGVKQRLVAISTRVTTEKRRYVTDRGGCVFRVDVETVTPVGDGDAPCLAPTRREMLHAILISDYGKGVVTEALVKEIMATCRGVIVVDPKGRDWAKYRGATLITPNLDEAGERLSSSLPDAPDDLCQALASGLPGTSVLLKLGAKGAYLWDAATKIGTKIAAHQVLRPDAIGAGDTVAAAVTVGLGAGMSLLDAAIFANAAAAVAVSKPWTATVTADEVRAALCRMEPS